MKHIPFVYPLSLAIIVVAMFFVGVYSMAESAVKGDDIFASEVALEASPSTAGGTIRSGEHDWYEKTAIFICPLH